MPRRVNKSDHIKPITPAQPVKTAFSGRTDIWEKKDKKPRVGAKTGKIGKTDAKIIAKLAKSPDQNTIEDICNATGRSPKQITEYLQKYYGVGEDLAKNAAETAEFIRDLEKRPEWIFRKGSFTKDEIEYYQYQYAILMNQFKHDILPTEEMQIFDLVDNLILANRHRKKMYDAEMEVKKLEHQIEMIGHVDLTDEDKVRKDALEGQRQMLLSQSKHRTQEWEILGKKKEVILQKLRSERGQRVQDSIHSNDTIVSKIKALQDKKVREREGRHMELTRIAADQAKERYSEPYQYMNGEWDQPILTSDRVLVENSAPSPIDPIETSLQTIPEAELINE